MKILLIASAVLGTVVLLVLLLLSVKTGLYTEVIYTKKEGFEYLVKFTWFFFDKQLASSEVKKPKKTGKTREKSDADAVQIIKSIAEIVKELAWIPGKTLVFKKQCVWCKVALEDPMKNGLVYPAVSAALMGAIQVIVCRFKTDEYKLRVTPDFVAKDGISIKNITWLQVRPLFLIICLVYAYTKSPALREAVRELLKEIKIIKVKGSKENEG